MWQNIFSVGTRYFLSCQGNLYEIFYLQFEMKIIVTGAVMCGTNVKIFSTYHKVL
jgi:hypothetical protein